MHPEKEPILSFYMEISVKRNFTAIIKFIKFIKMNNAIGISIFTEMIRVGKRFIAEARFARTHYSWENNEDICALSDTVVNKNSTYGSFKRN